MVPVSLKLKGVFSYKNEISIDFTKLTRNYLFGIFGRTGSGKSTILESIMYALYGEVSRLDNTKQTYNMMNLASNEFAINFIFEHKSETYRCIVTAKRKKKNYSETDTPEFRYFKLVDSCQLSVDSSDDKHDKQLSTINYQLSTNWLPLKNFKAKDILGLEANHFRKTVIIPQNEFQEFIQMTTTERIRMIKDIFVDLEKFDLDQKTRKLVDDCNLQMALKQEKLREIETLNTTSVQATPENLEKIKTDILVLESVRLELTQQKRASELALEDIIKVEKLHLNLRHLFTEREKLGSQKEKYDQIILHIELAEFYGKYLETPLALLKKSTEVIEHNKKQIISKTIERETLIKNIQTIENAREQHAETYKLRAQIEKQMEAQQLYLQVVEIEQILAPRQKEIEILKEQVGEINYEKRHAEEELKKLNAEYATLVNNAHDIENLTQLNNWYQKNETLKEKTSALKLKSEKIDADLETLQLSKNNIIETHFKQLQLPLNTKIKLKETIEILKSREKEFEVEQLEIAERIVQIKSNNKFIDAAKGLVDGKPCPLCGSIHHPDIFNAEEAHAQMDELYKLDASNKQLLERCRSIEIDLERLMQSASNLVNEKKLLEKPQTEIAAEQAHHTNSFIWHTFDKKDRKKLDAVLLEAQAHNQKSKTAQRAITQLTQQIEKLSKRIETLSLQKQAAEIEFTRLKTKREEIIQRISTADFEKWRTINPVNIQNEIQSQSKLLKLAISAFENSETTLLENNAALQKAEGSIAELEKLFQAQNLSHTASGLAISKILASAPLKTTDEWQAFEQLQIDLNDTRAQLNAYNNAVSLNADEILKTERALDGRIFSEERKLELITTLQNSDIQIEENIRQKAFLETQKTVTELNLKVKSETIQQLKALEYRSENLKKLQNLFARSGFVNYVSTVYLHGLCRRTNHRFMPLTYNRLQIDINANNDFIIKDNMNGGEPRSIKTLSGGQLFQVSLSLALALAENIQTMYNTDQNFFFLDEGFGSLDSESLTMVFQFLKVLQRENRIVGIISHVAEMQQEIENYLLVTLDDENGSEIETHY